MVTIMILIMKDKITKEKNKKEEKNANANAKRAKSYKVNDSLTFLEFILLLFYYLVPFCLKQRSDWWTKI